MKHHKLLSSMELIDEKYVEEANPDRKRKSRLARFGAIAAAVAIMITSVSVWLFIPYDKEPPDVSRHKNSQYYPLILKLNELTFKKPKYGNRFELYSSYLEAKEQSADIAAPINPSEVTSSNYVETTDNQVSGVIEADLIKRSDRYIFYLRGDTLSVYPINGMDTECISTYKIGSGAPDVYNYSEEMYLSEDCSTLNVILPCYSGRAHTTQIVSLDVTDPANITEKERVSVSGAYVSSRLTEGKLLLVTNFSVVATPDFSDESSFLPGIETAEGTVRPSMDEILCPDNATTSSFAVVSMFDPQDTKLVGSVACLSYSYGVYASADSLYLTRNFIKYDPKPDGGETGTAMTEITRISYSDGGLGLKGSVTIKGSVKDQYSLDEHNGVLRVAVTTSVTDYSKKYFNDYGLEEVVFATQGKPNASLYCLDKFSFEMLAAVENFAPEGERLQSARFDGDNAYICTSVMLSDPVFYFDLSDLDNITYKDTGTIEGFSSSLINFGDGYLLGIGVGASWGTVKIEVYKEEGDRIVSVDSKEFANSGYSTNYKAYFIDRDKGLVGLLISPYADNSYPFYLLLHFDGDDLETSLIKKLPGSEYTARAVLIDGCFYMFTDQSFLTAELN